MIDRCCVERCYYIGLGGEERSDKREPTAVYAVPLDRFHALRVPPRILTFTSRSSSSPPSLLDLEVQSCHVSRCKRGRVASISVLADKIEFIAPRNAFRVIFAITIRLEYLFFFFCFLERVYRFFSKGFYSRGGGVVGCISMEDTSKLFIPKIPGIAAGEIEKFGCVLHNFSSLAVEKGQGHRAECRIRNAHRVLSAV